MLELLGGLLLVVLAFFLVMAWVGYRVAKKVVRAARGFAQNLSPPGMRHAATAHDPRWNGLATHLDRQQKEAAWVAHQQIGALLAERGSGALTQEEAQLMIACERRVPELLDTCLDRCASALPGERCEYAGATLERLARIGQEAEAARVAIRSRDDGRLTTMHRYFDAVATKE